MYSTFNKENSVKSSIFEELDGTFTIESVSALLTEAPDGSFTIDEIDAADEDEISMLITKEITNFKQAVKVADKIGKDGLASADTSEEDEP
jgi:hypothetical protein